MSKDQTPIEGKGDEMIPDRGLPFDEVDNEEESLPVEDSVELETVEEVEEAVSQEPEEATPPISETSEADSPTGEEEEAARESTASEETIGAETQLLDIEEIRGRESELSEDSHIPSPDFDGEADNEFAAARIPIPLPGADREAIMLESVSGVLDEEALKEDAFVLEEELDTEAERPFPTTAGGSIGITPPDDKLSLSTPGIAEREVRIEESSEGKTIFSKETLSLPGPISGSSEVKAPELVSGLKATKKMLELLIPNQRVEELWQRADNLQQQIFEQVNDLNLARSLLEQIRSAKNLILADKENFEEAERAINEVEYRIIYGKRFNQWGLLGYILLVYEVIWGAVSILLLYRFIRLGVDGLNLNVEGLLSGNEIFIGILAALFGALGGVAGALFALWRYITEQKFNPQFSIWYVSQPIIGLVIGSIIYIILKIGFNITAGTVSAEIGSPLLPCLLAYLAGFQQNVFLDLVKQVFKQFKFGNKNDGPNNESASESTQTAG